MNGIDLIITLAVIIKVIDIVVKRSKRNRTKKDRSMFKIMFGVAFGIVLAGIITTAGWMLFTGAVLKEIGNTFQKTAQTKQIRNNQQGNAASKLLIQPAQSTINKTINQIGESFQPNYKEKVIRAKNAATYAKITAETERFKAHYKKPKECYNVTDNAKRVFCANDYIRARKAFEQANLAKHDLLLH